MQERSRNHLIKSICRHIFASQSSIDFQLRQWPNGRHIQQWIWRKRRQHVINQFILIAYDVYAKCLLDGNEETSPHHINNYTEWPSKNNHRRSASQMLYASMLCSSKRSNDWNQWRTLNDESILRVFHCISATALIALCRNDIPRYLNSWGAKFVCFFF